MKKYIVLCLLSVFLLSSIAFASTYVNGYTRSDGTYVNGYYRSSPNYTVRDNYSYYGNTNPYTGATGDNYYRNNKTSEYYTGYDNSYKLKSSYSY